MGRNGVRWGIGLAAILIAGCGGGGDDKGLSRADVVKRADAACKASTLEARAYVDEHTAPSTDAQTAQAYAGDAALTRRLAGRLGALKPSSDRRADFEALVAAERTLADRLAQAGRIAAAGTVAQLRGLSQGLLDTIGEAKAAATRYGLRECPGRPILAERTRTAEGEGVARFSDTKQGLEIAYPSNWHRKEVTDEPDAVAFGDATNTCAFIRTKGVAPLRGDALAADLRERVGRARDGAQGYRLIGYPEERNLNGLRGGGILRELTEGGTATGGHVAFLFGGGNRYTVDCVTQDPTRLDQYDKNLFRPVIISLKPTG